MPKFVEYEPKSESEQIESKLIEELKNCESIKLQSVAKIISDETYNFDINIAFEMLQDASKLLESDQEMAGTLFSRWLTMKSEQPSAEVSISQAEYLRLMDTLFPTLRGEFQAQAITVYLKTFSALEEVLSKVAF